MEERYEKYLMEDESLEDLELRGLMLIQKKEGFRFGVDAVLLSHFTNLKNKETVIDLCTGTGIIPHLFAGKTESNKIYGLEIQEKYVDMANRSVLLNGLEDRVKIQKGDLKDKELIKSLGKFSVVTANPPYKKMSTGIVNEKDELLIARHEYLMTLDDLIEASHILLKDQGRLILVHRPERLIDIITSMRKYNIEPKRIRTVSPRYGKAPNIILIEGIKGAKPYLKWEEELHVYGEGTYYSEEIKKIYGDERHG